MAVKRPNATFPPRVRRYRRERPKRRNPAFWDAGATEHHCFRCGKAITAPIGGILAECPECWANLMVVSEQYAVEGYAVVADDGFVADVFAAGDGPNLSEILIPLDCKRVRVTVEVLE